MPHMNSWSTPLVGWNWNFDYHTRVGYFYSYSECNGLLMDTAYFRDDQENFKFVLKASEKMVCH